MMRRYYNKRPPFTPDPEHWTKKVRSWKAKVSYETEDEAWEHLKQNPRHIEQGMTVYRCHVCSMWHICHKI